MKKHIIIFFLLISCSITAQQIERFSIDSGGESVLVSNIQLIYTIGEVNVQEISNGNTQLSEGFITPLFTSTLSVATNEISDLSVFPNPVNSILNIAASEKITKIKIYNQIGQVVKTKIVDNTLVTIDLTSLSAGVYLIKMEAGNKITNKQIIKR